MFSQTVKVLAGTFDGEPLVVEEVLDPKEQFYVLAAVHPLALGRLTG